MRVKKTVSILLVVVLSASLCQATLDSWIESNGSGNWYSVGRDYTRRGAIDYIISNPVNIYNWSIGSGTSYNSNCIEGDILVVGSNAQVDGWNLTSNSSMWTYSVIGIGSIQTAGSCGGDGQSYYQGMWSPTGGYLMRLNISTGNPICNFTANNPVYHSPLISEEGIVVFSIEYDQLVGVNKDNCSMVWNISCNSGVDSYVSYASGMIYAPCSDGFKQVYALNGTINWTGPVTERYNAIDQDYVYTSTSESILFLNRSTGAVLRNITGLTGVGRGGFTLQGDYVIQTRKNNTNEVGVLFAVNKTNGAILWNSSTTETYIKSELHVTECSSDPEKVYCLSGYYANNGSLHMFNITNGNLISSSPTAGGAYHQPILHNTGVYAYTGGLMYYFQGVTTLGSSMSSSSSSSSSSTSSSTTTSTTTTLDLPAVLNVSLNTTSKQNLTTDNLTVHHTLSNQSSKAVINWFKNGSSIMVLNMPFEGGSNATWTRDYSPYGLHGTVYGADYYPTGGYDSQGAYGFNMTIGDYIDVGDPPELDFEGDSFSISVWIKTGTASENNVISKGTVGQAFNWSGNDTGGNEQGYDILVNGSGRIKFRIGTIILGGDRLIVRSDTSIDDLAWHHICAVRDDNSMMHLYIDGVEEGTPLEADYNVSSDHVFKIGGLSYHLGLFFNGSIDDLQVYNHSLSSSQCQALYNNGTDLIVSNETQPMDVWRACITPTNSTLGDDGVEVCSNNLTIATTTTTLPCSDDYEPNDDNTEAYMATPLDFTSNLSRICPSGDDDWFKFDANESCNYTLETNYGSEDVDTELYLYDSADFVNNLSYNDDKDNTTLYSLIEWTAPYSGRYYLRVIGLADLDTGEYTVSISEDCPTIDLTSSSSSSSTSSSLLSSSSSSTSSSQVSSSSSSSSSEVSSSTSERSSSTSSSSSSKISSSTSRISSSSSSTSSSSSSESSVMSSTSNQRSSTSSSQLSSSSSSRVSSSSSSTSSSSSIESSSTSSLGSSSTSSEKSSSSSSTSSSQLSRSSSSSTSSSSSSKGSSSSSKASSSTIRSSSSSSQLSSSSSSTSSSSTSTSSSSSSESSVMSSTSNQRSSTSSSQLSSSSSSSTSSSSTSKVSSSSSSTSSSSAASSISSSSSSSSSSITSTTFGGGGGGIITTTTTSESTTSSKGTSTSEITTTSSEKTSTSEIATTSKGTTTHASTTTVLTSTSSSTSTTMITTLNCSQFCISEDYNSGKCVQNPVECSKASGFKEPQGNKYCRAHEAGTCCCLNATGLRNSSTTTIPQIEEKGIIDSIIQFITDLLSYF